MWRARRGVFGPGQHVPSDFPFPGVSTRLRDDAEFDPDEFAPVKNTVTTAKLLFLDGSELNRLLTDLRGRTILTYGDGSNYMVDPLSGAMPWLRSSRAASEGLIKQPGPTPRT